MTTYYSEKLKVHARNLRSNQTDAENLLWSRIRRKQLHNTQFNRQKPIGNYIVDFYAHAPQLVIEIDGGHHFEQAYVQKDKKRDAYLQGLNLRVLRFDNLQVLHCIDDVLEVIWRAVVNPPTESK